MAGYNDKTCDTCEHYDPVMRGQTGMGGLRETKWAWCAVRSEYPAKEGPGQKFPDGVRRVALGELAKPFIVSKGHVQSNCDQYMPKGVKPSKADLLKQLQSKEGRIAGS